MPKKVKKLKKLSLSDIFEGNFFRHEGRIFVVNKISTRFDYFTLTLKDKSYDNQMKLLSEGKVDLGCKLLHIRKGKESGVLSTPIWVSPEEFNFFFNNSEYTVS